jgi:U3 small nucleolar RNA-associated protein MPP10
MDQEQVWMQLDLRSQMICGLLDYALETGRSEEELSVGDEDDEGEDDDGRLQNIIEAIQNGEEIDLLDIHEGLGEEMDVDDESTEDDDESEGSENVVYDTEHIVQLRAEEEHSDNEDAPTLFDVLKNSSRSKKRKRADQGLNDEFFDLDAFNAETEQAEAKSSSRGQLANEDEDEEDEDMTLDLFAPVDEEEDESEGTGGAILFLISCLDAKIVN